MTALHPLRFHPILQSYVWGGQRLGTVLHKPIDEGHSWAESWEVCDLGVQQSLVAAGPLAGRSLAQLVAEFGKELLGKHCSLKQFPLLLKFLDAKQSLSVQVHPDDAYAGKLDPPQLGKTECWVVLEAEPDSKIYAGLKPGVDRTTLEAAISDGRCQDCLNETRPSLGDCYFLPAGTAHALGAGLLVAEIQQSSGVTYRLFDWNRLGPDGRPRPLHIEQALDVIDFNRGPVVPQRPQPTNGSDRSRLVECEYFGVERWDFDTPQSIGGDDRCHILCVIEGSVRVEGDPADLPLAKGGTMLLPAALGKTRLTPQGQTTLLIYDSMLTRRCES